MCSHPRGVTRIFPFSGVAGEGCGVIVEGLAPITEEAVATPPVADTKAITPFPCPLANSYAFNFEVHICFCSYLF